MKIEDKVYFKEDIIDAICEKHGKDKEIVTAIVNHAINRIKQIIKEDENVYAISCTRLGTLKASYHLLRDDVESKTSRKRREYMRYRYERNSHYQPTLFHKFFRNHTKKKRTTLFKKYYKHLEEIEKINNEVVKKYFK